MTTISGIYLIRQISTGLMYIGSSCHIYKRWQQHRRDLNNGKHHNRRLQSAWIIAGQSDFRFLVIDRCPREDLQYAEQFFLDSLKPWLPNNGFNESAHVERFALGLKRSLETRRKMSAALSGPKHPNWGKPANREAHEKTMLHVRGKKRPECGRRIVFTLTSPSGDKITFDGLRRFCRLNGLSCGNVSRVISGELEQTKGWRR